MNGREKRRVKLTDIAAKTGYTVGTISKALQNKEGISQETREAIMKAAKEIGYIAKAQAGALRSGSSKTIAIIVSDIANPLFAIEIKLCIETLEKHGYRAIVMDTEERPEREEQAVISALSKNVDGVLLCPNQKDTASIDLLRQNGMPFVLMGRRFEDGEDDYIVCDDERGGYLAGRHLAELGHEKILVITAGEQISSSRERLQGFKRALEESGIALDENLVVSSDASAHDSGRMIDTILDSGMDFSAIFTFSDYIAWEVIYALNRHGLQVPGDVSVMGFDDVQSHMCFPPPLTTVHYPKTKIATQCVELLLERIAHGMGQPVHRVLDTELVVRQSTAAPSDKPLAERLKR